MEDYRSKRTGDQIEALLDMVSQGGGGGGEGGGGITAETDPIFSASPAASITTEKISAWDDKEDKPIIFDAEKAGIEAGDGSEEYPGTFTPEQFQLATGMTFDEFYEAVQAGKRVVLRFDDSTMEPEAVDVTDDSIQVSYTKYNGQKGVALYCTTEYMMLSTAWLTNTLCEIFYTKEEIDANKQDKLVSGINIKTINGQPILGSGDIKISEGGDTSGLSERVDGLATTVNTLVSGNASTVIESFNEITAFLDGIEDSENLDNIIASIEQQIAGKYTKPSTGIPASDLAADVFLQGEQGPKGEDGVGITSVVQTTTSSADGGSNVMTVTLSDGKTSTFTVKNGSKGSQGEKGIQGEQGPAGANGTNGKDGADGEDGATFTPSVDANGNLSWTNDKGLTNPPTVNIKGPKGDSGEGGGSSSGGSISYPVVSIGDTTASVEGLNPNTYYQIFAENGLVSYRITVVLNEPTDSSVVNEYVFEFSVPDILQTPSISFPDTIKWANDAAPVIQENKTYVVSIVNNLAVFAEF